MIVILGKGFYIYGILRIVEFKKRIVVNYFQILAIGASVGVGTGFALGAPPWRQ